MCVGVEVDGQSFFCLNAYSINHTYTRAQTVEGTGVDKLGRITLEVWDAIKTAPVRTVGTVATAQVRALIDWCLWSCCVGCLDAFFVRPPQRHRRPRRSLFSIHPLPPPPPQSFGGGKMNEKALIKKGAFASTTKLGCVRVCILCMCVCHTSVLLSLSSKRAMTHRSTHLTLHASQPPHCRSEERVVVQQGGGGVSEYKTGYNKLETLELRCVCLLKVFVQCVEWTRVWMCVCVASYGRACGCVCALRYRLSVFAFCLMHLASVMSVCVLGAVLVAPPDPSPALNHLNPIASIHPHIQTGTATCRSC